MAGKKTASFKRVGMKIRESLQVRALMTGGSEWVGGKTMAERVWEGNPGKIERF